MSLLCGCCFRRRFTGDTRGLYCLIHWRRLDGDNRKFHGAVLGAYRDSVADFMAEQRLPNCRLIRDDVVIGIAIPGAEDGVCFFLVRLQVVQRNGCADGGTRGVGIFK